MTRYRQTTNIVARAIAGDTMLVPIRGRLADLRRVFLLEGAGGFVWRQLASPVSVTEIAERLSEEYEVSATDAMEDVRGFLAALETAQLVAKES